jgi:hypothetical protein
MNNWQKQNLEALAQQFASAQAVVVALDEVAEDRKVKFDRILHADAHYIVSALFILRNGDLNKIKAELKENAELYRGLGMTAYVNDWYAYELDRLKQNFALPVPKPNSYKPTPVGRPFMLGQSVKWVQAWFGEPVEYIGIVSEVIETEKHPFVVTVDFSGTFNQEFSRHFTAAGESHLDMGIELFHID